METFGQRLRSARERAMKTQAGLSQEAGVAIVTISRLETGDSPYPRPATVLRLASALGIDAATLMWGEETGTRRRKAPARVN